MYVLHEKQFAETCISSIRELRPEIWQNLTASKRIEVLQRCENAIAWLEDRHPAKVIEHSFDNGNVADYGTRENIIRISSELLKGWNSNPYVCFFQVAHEGLHAYIEERREEYIKACQDGTIKDGVIPNQKSPHNLDEVKEWHEAYEFYEVPQGNVGSDIRYKNNRLEIDCNLRAEFLVTQLRKEHEQQRTEEQTQQLAQEAKGRAKTEQHVSDERSTKQPQLDCSKREVVAIDKSGEEVRIPAGKVLGRLLEMQREKQATLTTQTEQQGQQQAQQKDERDKDRDR